MRQSLRMVRKLGRQLTKMSYKRCPLSRRWKRRTSTGAVTPFLKMLKAIQHSLLEMGAVEILLNVADLGTQKKKLSPQSLKTLTLLRSRWQQAWNQMILMRKQVQSDIAMCAMWMTRIEKTMSCSGQPWSTWSGEKYFHEALGQGLAWYVKPGRETRRCLYITEMDPLNDESGKERNSTARHPYDGGWWPRTSSTRSERGRNSDAYFMMLWFFFQTQFFCARSNESPLLCFWVGWLFLYWPVAWCAQSKVHN